MATTPLQDEPSGPDTEYSQSEQVQDLEPVLVLRTAKSLILPLRIPDQWEEQPFASAAPSYTSAHGMRLARKLVLGVDEGQVGYGSIRGWIEKSRFKKDAEVRRKLSATWSEFSGIVPML